MQKSDSIAELLKALSKFQGELPNPTKDSNGHQYKYADLANCLDVAKPHLASNGLSVIQLVGDVDGSTTIETILGHSSGEYISTTCHVPLASLSGSSGSNPAQIMGASITYMRRYQFAAIVGMAQADDDAASAEKGQAQSTKGKGVDKPWFNEAEWQSMNAGMVEKIINGDRTPPQILENLKNKYKLNKEMQNRILSLSSTIGAK